MDNFLNIKKIFSDDNLLTLALTHKSWVNEHPGLRGSNERLEFLGDAVLELLVSKHLFEKFPDKEEGYLTALRANLVNTINLSGLAKKLEVGPKIFLSKGEEEGGGRNNQSLLADTMEAIIGALYLNKGLDIVDEFITQNLLVEIPEKVEGPLKDPKSRLQELVQAKKIATPKYKVVEESGPDHDKKFLIHVLINGKTKGVGDGKSKSSAEQSAAEDALRNMSNL